MTEYLITKRETCYECVGEDCPKCDGSGIYSEQVSLLEVLNRVVWATSTCEECRGFKELIPRHAVIAERITGGTVVSKVDIE